MRIFLLALAVLLSACNKNASEPAASPPAEGAPVPPAAAAPQALAAEPAQPSAAAPSAGGLTWSAPKPFVSRAPKSTMRVAEYGIDGDSVSELGVFYFGADQGGTVEANMSRWVGQFSQPDGKATLPQRKATNVGGVIVEIVEATGTFNGGMGMGAAQAEPQVDAMLLGAIAKGPQGSVFFKLVGPRATVENARDGFDGLIQSLRVTK